jgi:hypothetical protein
MERQENDTRLFFIQRMTNRSAKYQHKKARVCRLSTMPFSTKFPLRTPSSIRSFNTSRSCWMKLDFRSVCWRWRISRHKRRRRRRYAREREREREMCSNAKQRLVRRYVCSSVFALLVPPSITSSFFVHSLTYSFFLLGACDSSEFGFRAQIEQSQSFIRWRKELEEGNDCFDRYMFLHFRKWKGMVERERKKGRK